jgi:hypothetical protein
MLYGKKNIPLCLPSARQLLVLVTYFEMTRTQETILPVHSAVGSGAEGTLRQAQMGP